MTNDKCQMPNQVQMTKNKSVKGEVVEEKVYDLEERTAKRK
jgi:hypothetical protein